MVSMKYSLVRVTPVLTALALSACTVVPYEQAQTTPGYSEPTIRAQQPDILPESATNEETLVVPQQPEVEIAENSASSASLPAAQRMRQLASAEGEKGEYRRAVALLERALRISPRDPETYYELARNHMLLGDPAQALQLARRGLSLSPTPEQRTRLEQLVDESRAALTA